MLKQISFIIVMCFLITLAVWVILPRLNKQYAIGQGEKKKTEILFADFEEQASFISLVNEKINKKEIREIKNFNGTPEELFLEYGKQVKDGLKANEKLQTLPTADGKGITKENLLNKVLTRNL